MYVSTELKWYYLYIHIFNEDATANFWSKYIFCYVYLIFIYYLVTHAIGLKFNWLEKYFIKYKLLTIFILQLPK